MKNFTDMKRTFTAVVMMWAMAMLPIAAAAQTRVTMPKNKYNVQDDVKLGRQAAVEIERQFPVLNDRDAEAYVQRVGERLVNAIPPEFRQPAFNYNFKVVNASDINAFALPGGPMYVNRGMIQAARNEGEMAGVMAHEISHVALRHATAQATKQSSVKNQLGQLGLILGGAILGGQTGAQLGMLGAAAWQTKYSRDYETQADVLGSHIMAAAGYDPRDLANMFQTIANQSRGGGPEWLSSHPDPGNRFQKINQEAARLDVSSNPIKLTRDFSRVKERMQSLPPAPTMAQLEQAYKNGGGGSANPTAGGNYSRSVSLPSSRTRRYDSAEMSVNVPSNWRDMAGSGVLIFAPEGAYGNDGITHGAMFGVHRSNTNNIQSASREYIEGMMQANPYLRARTNMNRATVAGRSGYSMVLTGTSPITNRTEQVTIYTTPLRNGGILYIATVSPEGEASRYSAAFRNMISSIRIND